MAGRAARRAGEGRRDRRGLVVGLSARPAYLARLAEAGGLELRVFVRDGDTMLRKGLPDPAAGGNADLVVAYANDKNGQQFASVPVADLVLERLGRAVPPTSSTRPSITRIGCSVTSAATRTQATAASDIGGAARIAALRRVGARRRSPRSSARSTNVRCDRPGSAQPVAPRVDQRQRSEPTGDDDPAHRRRQAGRAPAARPGSRRPARRPSSPASEGHATIPCTMNTTTATKLVSARAGFFSTLVARKSSRRLTGSRRQQASRSCRRRSSRRRPPPGRTTRIPGRHAGARDPAAGSVPDWREEDRREADEQRHARR